VLQLMRADFFIMSTKHKRRHPIDQPYAKTVAIVLWTALRRVTIKWLWRLCLSNAYPNQGYRIWRLNLNWNQLL